MFNAVCQKTLKRTRKLVLYAAGLLTAWPAFAGAPEGGGITSAVQGLSAQDMINRISEQIPNLMQMVTAIAYVMGMFMIYIALLKFKRFGEMRTMMSMQHHLSEPVTYLFAGAMLLYLPSSVQVGMSTFWAEPNPYGYLQQQDQWSLFINNCFLVVQLFGTIAFIRGLLILTHASKEGGGGGALGRALTHIIGGVFCINIYQFVQVILFTIGIET